MCLFGSIESALFSSQCVTFRVIVGHFLTEIGDERSAEVVEIGYFFHHLFLDRLHGRVVKGVGHLGHDEAMEAGGREFDRGTIVG